MKHQPRKRFGQNFLHDPGVIGRIVDAVNPQPAERLVEIGPGQGALTFELLRRAGELDAVELDRDLIAPLIAGAAEIGELRVHAHDALSFDFGSLAPAGDALRVVGNLPYNISTPLLFHLLSFAERIRDLHLMLQKEVVDRMVAEPGGKTYGRLSVMVQALCDCRQLFVVGPGAFYPAPKVHSAVIRLVPRARSQIAEVDPGLFAEIVARAFAQRRKTLRNGLRGLMEPESMEAAGINPGARAETLSVTDFVALTKVASDTPGGPGRTGSHQTST